jgi:hypothetical protein
MIPSISPLPGDALITIFSFAPKEIGSCLRVCKMWSLLASDSRLWEQFVRALFPATYRMMRRGSSDWRAFAKEHCLNHVPCHFIPMESRQLVTHQYFPLKTEVSFLNVQEAIAYFLSADSEIYSFDPATHTLQLFKKLPFLLNLKGNIYKGVIALPEQCFALLCEGTVKIIDQKKGWALTKEHPIDPRIVELEFSNDWCVLAKDGKSNRFLLDLDMKIIQEFGYLYIPKNRGSSTMTCAFQPDEDNFHVIDFNPAKNAPHVPFKILMTFQNSIASITDALITPQAELVVTFSNKKIVVIDLKNKKSIQEVAITIPKYSHLECDEKGQISFYSTESRHFAIFDPYQAEFREVSSPHHFGHYPISYTDKEEEVFHLSTLQKLMDGVLFFNHHPIARWGTVQYIVNSRLGIKPKIALFKLQEALMKEKKSSCMTSVQKAQFLALPDRWRLGIYKSLDNTIYLSTSHWWTGKESFLCQKGQSCTNEDRAKAIKDALQK